MGEEGKRDPRTSWRRPPYTRYIGAEGWSGQSEASGKPERRDLLETISA